VSDEVRISAEIQFVAQKAESDQMLEAVVEEVLSR